MVELMELLLDVLCPTSNSASQCQNFLSASNHQVLMPFGPYIYFLLFPTVFMLLFLWLIFKDVVRANKGISLIATVAIYVFIIINGMYPVFLWLGELWIIVIIILGFLWLLIRRFVKEKGGGGGGKMPGFGGGGLSAGRLVKKAAGMEKSQAEFIEAQIDLFENSPRGGHGVDAMAARIDADLRAFGAETGVLGKGVASDYDRLKKKFLVACKEKGIKASGV